MYVKREKPEGYTDPRTIRAKEAYEGKVYKCKDSDQQYVIERFIDFKHVQIYFLDTYNTRRTVTMNDIQNGVLDPYMNFPYKGSKLNNSPFCWVENIPDEKKFLGLTFKTNEGYFVTIIKYEGTSKVTVQFSDTGYTMTTTMQNVKKGQVHNPFKVNKFGGYEGAGPYKTKEYEWLYNRWYNMLVRSDSVYYNSHRGSNKKGMLMPTDAYYNIMITPQFLNYSFFAEWYLREMSQLNPNYDYDIDKDCLYHQYKNATGGRKCYGPDTCILIPHSMNVLLTEQHGSSKFGSKQNNGYTEKRIVIIKEAADNLLSNHALTQKSYSAIMSYLMNYYIPG